MPILSALAFFARDVPLLTALTLIDGALFVLMKGKLVYFGKEIRFFGIQAMVITGLYIFRFGVAEGIPPGLKISWQLILVFLPGMIMMKTIPQHIIVNALERVIPYRMAFAISTSLRFIPLLIREAKTIYEVQLLRGAKILPRDVLKPRHWPDVIHCLVVPVIVQGLVIAGEISRAATARGFGTAHHRTHWRG